ncbi:amino acid adenylation domain-containing protein [Streptomyces rosealbus]
MSFRPADLVEMLRARAAATPEATAYILLEEDGSERRLTYGELDVRARATAAAMQQSGAAGGRALLLYPPGEEYVVGFFGCLYSGTAAVPVYPPSGKRGLDRLMDIVTDAEATVALTDDSTLQLVTAMGDALGDLGKLAWTATDTVARDAAPSWAEVTPGGEALAFLQYTSGSTGSPKGVMLRHGNLIENSRTIARANGSTTDSVGVSWLPPYHDMGLIGGILQPLYSGFPCVLMAPMTFLRRPFRWLEAISRHGGTMSAAPDFAYAECVRRVTEEELAGLDLSSWEHAMVGAEPVRRRTLDDFVDVFGPAGFRRSSFHPCYGLAEATLFVTGGKPRTEPLAVTVTDAGPRPLDADGAPGTTLIGCGDIQGEDRILVVDTETLLPAADDAVGEVWVTGGSVAQGYWRRPELTEQTFAAELAEPDGRTYLRTGDLAFRHQGELFVTGRIKDLIVVRGRNHYPQDIEYTAELSHDLLVPNRAAAFGLDDGTDERVVLLHEVSRAFRDEDADAVLAAIRTAVTEEHGLALHDIVLVRMGALPRTSSGKIRRRESRERYAADSFTALASSGGATAPAAEDSAAELLAADPAATAVLAHVGEVLDLAPERVSATLPLIAQGLDSLRAVRLRALLETDQGADVPLAVLLGDTTVAQLAAVVAESKDRGELVPIGRREGGGSAPVAASFGQERLWLLDRLGAGSAYHVAGGLRVSGALDVGVLERAVGEVMARHEALRTRFVWADGGLQQVVEEPSPLAVSVGEVAGDVDSWLASVVEEPFDLAVGPLVRVVVGRVANGEWVLALVAHHAVVDGWSLGIVMRELGAAYAAFAAGAEVAPLPELGLQYGDFAAWQRDTVAGEALESGLAHWAGVLDGAHALELPTSSSRSESRASYDLGVLPVVVGGEVAGRVRSVAEAGRATVFQTVLASFAAVLGRWAGQSDVVLGTPVAGRSRSELDDVVGFFVNTLALRVGIEGDPTFAELVERARATTLDALAHQDIPFEKVAQRVGAGLVRVLFALDNTPRQPVQLPGMNVSELVAGGGRAQFELALHLREQGDGTLVGRIEYAADLFDAETVGRLHEAWQRLLAAMTGEPGRSVHAHPLPGEAELRQIAAFSNPLPEPAATGLMHEAIAAQAARTPDAIAVTGEEGHLTYRELDEAANRLAHHLQAQGVGVEDVVGLCLHRSLNLIISLVGVLKTGAAYLPLDPDYPPARLTRMATTSRTPLILTHTPTRDLAETLDLPANVHLLDLETEEAAITARPATAPAVAMHPDNAAYVLYTSGSTGQPKGAVNTHAAFTNRIAWMQHTYHLTDADRVLFKTPIGFDVNGWEWTWPLTTGARIHLTPPGHHRDPAALATLIQTHHITIAHFVPSMLRYFLNHPTTPNCTTLRHLIVSGEELTPHLTHTHHTTLPTTQLHNLYGPTEAAIDVTAHTTTPTTQPTTARIPIGTPINATNLHILDTHHHPTPLGTIGTLHIGGTPLARGYHHQPALTADRFTPHPTQPGQRLYNTGDLAHWNPDGTLTYHGRTDHQIKIRGQRIEPAEIDTALQTHPHITHTITTTHTTPDHHTHLATYYTTNTPTPPTPTQLRTHLTHHLPPAMIPTYLTHLTTLPQHPNGKINTTQLPPPVADFEGLGAAGGEHVEPRDEVERELAQIWTEVLGVPAAVGVRDDFYALGGHSLLAVQIVSRVRDTFGVELPLERMISGRPTVEALAEAVQEIQLSDVDEAELLAALATL